MYADGLRCEHLATDEESRGAGQGWHEPRLIWHWLSRAWAVIKNLAKALEMVKIEKVTFTLRVESKVLNWSIESGASKNGKQGLIKTAIELIPFYVLYI